jgi:hypothetical protein
MAMPVHKIYRGIDPAALSDEELMRELSTVHSTRNDALRHGSEAALDNHTRRTDELEAEYLKRFPHREIDPSRLRGFR